MMIANQITKVIAPLTNAWLDFGTNDMMLPVSPPEMNVKSAGMIGSFRSWTLMLLATPKAVRATPKTRVAIQNRFVTKLTQDRLKTVL